MMSESRGYVVGGVDTHKDQHVAVVLDATGQVLGEQAFETNTSGYSSMLAWFTAFGELAAVGIEGSGSYGVGLSRHLTAAGVVVHEVMSPKRQTRRRHGKSDSIDAEAAARCVLAGHDLITPKSADGDVENMRALRLTRHSAIKARDSATNQLHALIVTADDDLRRQFAQLPIEKIVSSIINDDRFENSSNGYERAMSSLARRWRQLDDEAKTLAAILTELVQRSAPAGLLDEQGVGSDVAAALMIAAGDNPHRLRSEASFAALCGVSPLDASSGKQQRHRLNRGGNRDANMALWRIVLVRLRWDPITRSYLERRIAEGKTKREAIRCLKRYIARDIYKILTATNLAQLST
jgi:transposase